MIESVYGLSKRLEFVAGVIADFHPKRVLDVGCGTGANLTALLAQRFPETNFVGIDSDPASIAYASRETPAGNAQYFVETAFGNTETFDYSREIYERDILRHTGNSEMTVVHAVIAGNIGELFPALFRQDPFGETIIAEYDIFS